MSSRYIGGIVTKNPTALNPALGNAANGIFTMDQYAQQKAAGTWPAYDPYSKYTTLLLHGDGTNGGQNNTFLDSSTNNFTITRNGNTTQGSFSPYGSNWSNYFDGSGDYLTAPTTIALSGDFCIEAWFNSTTTVTYASIFSDESGSNGATILLNNGSNNGQITVYATNIVSNFASSSTGLNDGKWHHVAFTRSGSTCRLFIDGALQNTATSSGTSSGTTTRIGSSYFASRDFLGYISNFRLVTGAAIYTAAFTPSTVPLTAITGTQVLTCQSNRFIDNSSNNFTLTVNGTPSVQRFSPFAPSAAYSTATIGGSGYFDGTGDYLSVAASANQDFGSSSFTVEFWWYPNADSRQWFYHASTDYWFGIDYKSSGSYMGLWASSNGTSWNLINADPGGNGISSGTPKINAWNHVAVGRSSGTWSMWLNGTRVLNLTGITSAIVSRSAQAKIIGGWAAGSQYIVNGYMNDFRVVIGTDVYGVSNSTITVPTAPLTAITNTQLLTNFTNGSIYDNAMMIDLETVGNAQISTSVKKYGTGSLYFDGSGDALRGPANIPQAQFGTGDFTVECWLYQTATNTYPSIVEVGNHVAAGGILFIASNGSTITAYSASYGGFMGTATAPSLNTWNHIAWVRYNGTFKIYVNGVGNTGVTATTNFNSSTTLTVGAEQSLNASYTYTGYIDDLRITKGYARYTANFTPPTSQLQDQ